MKIDNKISPFLTGPYIIFGLTFIPVFFFTITNQIPVGAVITFLTIWYLFATYSGVEINTGERKFRDYNKHFGLFKTGRWRSLDQYIGLTLVPMKITYRMYSRSNRINDSGKIEYRIYLVNRAKKPAIPIKKCKNEEEGHRRLDELSIWLKLPVYSPR